MEDTIRRELLSELNKIAAFGVPIVSGGVRAVRKISETSVPKIVAPKALYKSPKVKSPTIRTSYGKVKR